MLWLLVIFLAPLPGAFMYLFYGNKRTGKQLEQRIKDVNITIPVQLNDDTELMKALETENKSVAQTFGYVKHMTGFPVLKNETAQYYPVGELLFV